MEKEQEIVSTFDSGLTFRFDFNPWVYEVEKNGEIYVLKIRKPRKHLANLEKEAKALNLAYNITGITNLVEEHHQEGELKAILKEYARGKTLSECGNSLNINLQEQLSNIVYKLHQRGISGLDLIPKNIIVSDDEKELFLFDFDICYSKEEIGLKYFKGLIERDLLNLKYLCSTKKAEVMI